MNSTIYKLGIGPSVNPVFTESATLGQNADPPDASDYEGNEAKHTGFFALDMVDLFNIMVIPDDISLSEDERMGLWAPASTYCKKRRAILLIGPPQKLEKSFA